MNRESYVRLLPGFKVFPITKVKKENENCRQYTGGPDTIKLPFQIFTFVPTYQNITLGQSHSCKDNHLVFVKVPSIFKGRENDTCYQFPHFIRESKYHLTCYHNEETMVPYFTITGLKNRGIPSF